MMYNLTEYSHGAGCGCKLSPGVLADIIDGAGEDASRYRSLLVGNETKDDAAVFDLDGTTAIISTTDFFMPIVDDPMDFGRIAATNAISDIYAMGGEPLMAIAILGWPIDKIPGSVASLVLKGGREVCRAAGIPLAGGHSIDAPEPIFGLAVTGKVPASQVKKNRDGKPGDLLYLTKPIGVGFVTTAQKRKKAEQRDLDNARAVMLTLNKAGKDLANFSFVHALTDVTGFGLAGHLLEICEASKVCATLWFDHIPLFDFVPKYLAMDCIPGGTHRNWKTYGDKVFLSDERRFPILADPQTSGGLLISIDPGGRSEFERYLSSQEMLTAPIGILREHEQGPLIKID